MKERPILFNGDMVRAILDGRKTQTRRAVNPKWLPLVKEVLRINGGWVFDTLDYELTTPFGKPGDRLWVRETWAHDAPDPETARARFEDALSGGETYGPYYRATESAPRTLRWRPSIHMPRWASRITLEVTAVRVERVQEITTGDAWNEGCPHSDVNAIGLWFKPLWNTLYGTWDTNPWVWVVEFKKLEGGL